MSKMKEMIELSEQEPLDDGEKSRQVADKIAYANWLSLRETQMLITQLTNLHRVKQVQFEMMSVSADAKRIEIVGAVSYTLARIIDGIQTNNLHI